MTRRAFTIIELLAVIAIIAVLLSILLPSLSRAREAGRGVACQGHERGVVMAMAAYESENKGYLVGPNTSGARLNWGQAYEVGTTTPTQDWDFVSPLLGESLNFSIDQLQKFQDICMTKLRCPSNRVRYTRRFSGAPLPIEAQGEQPFTLSYLTPAYLQLYPSNITTVGGRPVESMPTGEPVTIPAGYLPRSDLVGRDSSKKIVAFEGARYFDPAINGFDYSTGTNGTGLVGTPQGNFLSRGSAFFGSGENYLRDQSRGYKPSDILKQISLRHDERMNAGMLDGHVETMNNVQDADPTFYVPSRSKLKTPTLTWWYYVGPANSPLRQANALIP